MDTHTMPAANSASTSQTTPSTTPATDAPTTDADTDSDPDSVSKESRLRTYLHDRVQDAGEIYVKSRFIADDVDLSPKEIGAIMVKLREDAELTIEEWSSSPATTWRIATA